MHTDTGRNVAKSPRAASVKRDTAEVILDTAERLCAAHGIEAVSIRDIAAEADVGIAVIYHHYQSKSNLLQAILRTRFQEIQSEYSALLTEIEAQNSPTVRDILRAVLQPFNRWRTPERQAALQFYALALVCPFAPLREAIDRGVVGLHRVVALLQRVLPRLSHEDVCWRLHFTMKITHLTKWDNVRLGILSKGQCRIDDDAEALTRAVAFAEAAFLAPPFIVREKPSIPGKSKFRRDSK